MSAINFLWSAARLANDLRLVFVNNFLKFVTFNILEGKFLSHSSFLKKAKPKGSKTKHMGILYLMCF